ncbi:hypothetical protein DXG03_004021 [Asterophora parasitica]|uniref:Aminotransferase class V domain-containing protein n=1 Tax=Asterophora parasitica TaxID=117018 RepID=A0A9P7KBK3_9AGAR|nr:hypothetical protein DXG03_004021 [Asterophora parasitica]
MAIPDSAELYKQPPPKFGHDLLKYFAFDPEYLNLNSGSYGATPRPVLDAVNKLALEVEANPDLFHRLQFQERLIDVRRRLAQLIGADVDEVVLVSNASTGINIALRNFEWEKGDTLIAFNTTYGSVDKTVKNIGDVPPYPTIEQFVVQFPTTHKEIVANFKEFIAALPTAEGKKTVVVIDSIISNPGVLLPWKELVAITKEVGAWSVVDAAHSIGQETDINLSEAQPDIWVSNCHKWLSAKRAVAVLYVPKRNHDVIKTSLPTSHSYALWESFTGIRSLNMAQALDFRNWLGGEHKINEYSHALALEGGKRLAEILGTRVMDPDGELTLNMVNVELPFPGTIRPTEKLVVKFQRKLLEEKKAFSAFYYHNDRWWTRCSAQIWNELEDFEKLGNIWVEACQEILEDLGVSQTS